ncbi:hypothetical protein E2C01_036456 [Portunus trituberculatus]|uniref:Secreted protein n=1 Tax=Portunus trituberculatus TaxID=210409 RepID=A0A5B7FBE7_PORTR|nr:hypothetical protein [Portunus trituberculatus]
MARLATAAACVPAWRAAAGWLAADSLTPRVTVWWGSTLTGGSERDAGLSLWRCVGTLAALHLPVAPRRAKRGQSHTITHYSR